MQKDEAEGETEKDLYEMTLKEIVKKTDDIMHTIANQVTVLAYCLELIRRRLKED
jgi:hypothetical protein